MAAGSLWINLGLRSAAFDKGLKRSRSNLKGFTSQVKTLAATIGAGLGLRALSRGISSSVKQFAEFQTGMAMVSTMLDDQTMRLMPAFNKQIRSLSKEMGESTDTLSRGLFDVLSAGISAGEAMKVLRVATISARGGFTDTATSADALTTILNAYGMAAESATEISDKMFAVIKRGKLTFEDYAPNIGKVASLAATAGVAFEDLNASISTLTRAGVQTEIAMTGIRQVIAALIEPSKEAVEAAAEFGLILDENTLRTTGLVGMMDKLRDATLKQLSAIIPNIRGMSSFAAGLRQADGAMSDLKLQYNSAGLAMDAFNKRQATVGTELDIQAEKWKDLKVSIGEIVAGPYTALLSVLLDTADSIKQIIALAPQMGTAIADAMKSIRVPMSDIIRTLDALERAGVIKAKEGVFTPLKMEGGVLVPDEEKTGAESSRTALPRVITSSEMLAKQAIIEQAGLRDDLQIRSDMRMQMAENTRVNLQRLVNRQIREREEKERKHTEMIRDRWEWVGQGMAQSMTSAADKILFESGKLRDALHDIFRSIARDMAQAFIFTPFSEALVGGAGQLFGLPQRVQAHSGLTVPSDGLYALQRGEHVTDRANARGGTPPTVIINNNSGVPVQQEGQPRFEAGQWVVNVVSENISNRGVLYQQTRT